MALPSAGISETPDDSRCQESWTVPAWIIALVDESSLRGSRVPSTAVKKWQCSHELSQGLKWYLFQAGATLKNAYHWGGIFLLHALPALSDFNHFHDDCAFTIHMMNKILLCSLGNRKFKKFSSQNSRTIYLEMQLHRIVLTFIALNGTKLIIDFDILETCKLENLQLEDSTCPTPLGLQCKISWDTVNSPTRRIFGKICNMLSLRSMEKMINNEKEGTISFSLPYPEISPSLYETGLDEDGEDEVVGFLGLPEEVGDGYLTIRKFEYFWVKTTVDT